MISEAKTVTDYLNQAPENRKQALTKLRNLCKEILTGYEEKMAYGGPGYSIGSQIEIGFGSQKNFIGFYCLIHHVMLDNQDLLKGLSHGKGAIRFPNPDKIDFELIKKLLTDTLNSDSKPC